MLLLKAAPAATARDCARTPTTALSAAAFVPRRQDQKHCPLSQSSVGCAEFAGCGKKVRAYMYMYGTCALRRCGHGWSWSWSLSVVVGGGYDQPCSVVVVVGCDLGRLSSWSVVVVGASAHSSHFGAYVHCGAVVVVSHGRGRS